MFISRTAATLFVLSLAAASSARGQAATPMYEARLCEAHVGARLIHKPEFGNRVRSVGWSPSPRTRTRRLKGTTAMSVQTDNKAIVGRWFTEFWGKDLNLAVIDEIAAPDMLLKYSLHEPRRGHDDIRAFMTDFRAAFPDLNFWGTADLIAEGNYVVGQWEGGGTHTGPAFADFLIGGLPAATGRRMRFTGTTVLKLQNGRIVAEIGLDDGVTALTQLGLLRAA